MADFNALETLINAYIKKNGVQAITGNILNGVLRGMVSALGKGYTIVGVATPSTDPGTLTGPCAYYASTYGTYTNFGNIVVNDGEIAMLIYDEQTWHKEKMWRLDAEASIDANVGTPSVETSFEDEVLTFRFHNIKGNPGDAAGFGTVNATVDSNIGTPGVSVQTSGPDTAKNMTFQFTNLKGETGVTSVVCTVDNTIGTPSCAVSLVGQELHLDFSGLKGNKGDTGVSADYPITIYNGLDSTATDQALSAYQGKVLKDELSQLDLKVDEELGGFFVVNNPIKKDTGAVQTSTPTFKNTGYIPIKNYSDIEIYGYDGGNSYNYTICAFYDEDLVFISSYPNTTAGMQKVTIPASSIPSGAVYIRCTTQAGKAAESYVFCNISKVLADNQRTSKTEIATNKANINLLNVAQHGIISAVDSSVAANARLQQYVATTDKTVRFRVTLLSGTPSVTSYLAYGGTESTPLGVVVIRGCEFGKVYTTKIRDVDTGITVRSSTSSSAFSARVEILNNVSDDAKNIETERHATVKTLYDINYSKNADGRLSVFYPCTGALRVTVKCTSGTPTGKYYRLYFGTEGTPTSACAMGNTPFGNTTEVFLSEDYTFTGITVFTVTADTSNVNYNIIIEKLDTDEQKLAHHERMLCIGDSITAFDGQNSIGTGVGRDGMRYSDYMQIFRPGITLTNIGIGGTRLAQRTATLPDTPTDNSHAYAALDMVNLVKAVCSGDFSVQDAAATYLADVGITAKIARAKLVDITKIDIVTILGGTNDWTGNQTLGTVDGTDETTTLGALNTIISTLLTANPRIRIYIALPPVRYVGSTYTDPYWCDTYQNENGQTLIDLCESLESVAANKYTPVIDLHRDLGWNKENFWSFFISPDGTHPIAGFRWIADKIMRTIF